MHFMSTEQRNLQTIMKIKMRIRNRVRIRFRIRIRITIRMTPPCSFPRVQGEVLHHIVNLGLATGFYCKRTPLVGDRARNRDIE